MLTLTTKFQIQREREHRINPHNPMYKRTLSYKLAANNFTFVGRVILKNECFGIILEGDANNFQLSNVHLPHRFEV